MIIYFFVAILSLLCIYFGLRYAAKSKWLGRLLIVAGIVLPCLLAAGRSVEIGTDTNGYISHLFGLAQKTDNIGELFSTANSWYTISDPLYVVLNFLVAYVFNNFHVFLFFAELLIIVPIFVALYKSRKSDKEILIGMTLFFLFEYNVTFNMLRQGIAISFIVLMIYFLTNGKNLKSVICLLIAIGFHSIAMICLPVLFIYWALKNIKEQKRKMVSVVVYVSLITFVIFFEGIVMLLYNMGAYEHGKVFLERYSTHFDFSFIDTATYLIAIIAYWLGSNWSNTRKGYNHDFYMILGIGSLILLSLGWKVMYLERVSFYLFYPFLLYVVPKILQGGDDSKGKKKTYISRLVFVLMVYFVLYWVVEFAVFNIHSTVPYKFASLGMI